MAALSQHSLNDIRLVAQRELRHYLRDPHVLIYSVLLPALLYPITILVAIEGMLWQESLAEKRGFKVGITNNLSVETTAFVTMLRNTPNVKIIASDDPVKALKDGELDAVLTPGSGPGTTPGSGQSTRPSSDPGTRPSSNPGTGPSAGTQLLTPPAADTDFFSAKSRMEKLSEKFQDREFDKAMAARHVTNAQIIPFKIKQVNVSKVASATSSVILFICGLALLMMSLGAIYPAISAFTEEHEKKTLQSTLMMPVDRVILVLGKHAANTLITFTSATVNIICVLCVAGLLTNLPQAKFLELDKSIWFTPAQFGLVMLAFVITAAEISALYLLISQTARSFKEAQNLLTIPSLLFAMLPLTVLSPAIGMTFPASLIPFFNTFMFLKAIYSNNTPWNYCILAMTVNIGLTVLMLSILSKIVDHEQFSTAPLSFGKILTALKAKR